MAKRGRKPKTPLESRPAWAQRLARARAARNLSQKELAAVVDASQSAIGDYETGENEPSLAVFQRLASALRVSPQWLIFGQKGFAESGTPLADDEVPDDSRRDDEFADVMVETRRILTEENMPSDDRTVINLAQQLWREIEAMDAAKMSFRDRFQQVMEVRRAALRAAKRLAFNPIRH